MIIAFYKGMIIMILIKYYILIIYQNKM